MPKISTEFAVSVIVVVVIFVGGMIWFVGHKAEGGEDIRLSALSQKESSSQKESEKKADTRNVSKSAKAKVIDLADWKTYTSKVFGISVSIPIDWKAVMPADGTLVPLNENSLEGYSVIEGPEKEHLVFMEKPLDIAAKECQKSRIKINDLNVDEIVCKNVGDDEIPGKLNYEFVDRNLVIILDRKTETIDKIISSIR